MASLRFDCLGLVLLTLSSLGVAQSPEVSPTDDKSSQPTTQSPTQGPDADTAADESAARPRRRARPVPCWRQAGMTPEMVNQRWKLEDSQKTRIAAVCSEPSMSAQQRHERIQQIQVETDQAIARLIPTKERQAFNQCQSELEKSRPHPAGEKELGPCGAMPEPADEHSHH
jgi:hypothetical protein